MSSVTFVIFLLQILRKRLKRNVNRQQSRPALFDAHWFEQGPGAVEVTIAAGQVEGSVTVSVAQQNTGSADNQSADERCLPGQYSQMKGSLMKINKLLLIVAG